MKKNTQSDGDQDTNSTKWSKVSFGPIRSTRSPAANYLTAAVKVTRPLALSLMDYFRLYSGHENLSHDVHAHKQYRESQHRMRLESMKA